MSQGETRPSIVLDDRQRFDWLRLIRTEGVGPRTFRSLVNHFGGAGAALENLPDFARARGARGVSIPDPARIERELEQARRYGVRFVATGEQDYPRLLAAIDSAPPLLAVRGHAATCAAPSVAIVGARNASAGGRRIAEKIAQGLGQAGFVVSSGLARGIDTAAHAASLQTGTVAVLAGGHDKVYPPENEALLEAIAERGAVVSEMPMGWEPRGRDFPRRNRLVSGLALGVVLVEAARRSGSLITARFALEQGREVFVVPGSPLDPRCEGTNDLIRQGATLVQDASDIVDVLAPLVGIEADPGQTAMRETEWSDEREPLWDELDFFDLPASTTSPRARGSMAPIHQGWTGDDPGQDSDIPRDPSASLRALLGWSPVSVDELVRQSGLPAREVQALLLDLELEGRLDRPGPQLVALRPGDRH
jgi:DNA processing protein